MSREHNLTYADLVYIDQALSESIERYQMIMIEAAHEKRYVAVLRTCQDHWKSALAKVREMQQ